MMLLPYIYMGAGILFALYFVILWIYCSRIPAFGWFWMLIGTVCFTAGWKASDKVVLVLSWIGLIIVLLFAAGVQILRTEGNKKAEPGAEYVIVLGARVNGIVPSKALRNRIQTAYGYLMENPGARAVLTGGKGPGEEITEAACMEKEFLKLGIDRSRLILESESTSTMENIAFAKKLITNKTEDTFVVIVTSDFHALRGRIIGTKAGFARVETLGAPSSVIMKPHYYTREILSWIKFGISMMLVRNRTGDR